MFAHSMIARLTPAALVGNAPWGPGGLPFSAVNWGNTAGGFIPAYANGGAVGGTFVSTSELIGVDSQLWGLLFIQQTGTVPSNRSLIVQVNSVDVAALTLNLLTGESVRSVFANFNILALDRVAIRHTTGATSAATCDMRCLVLVRPR